MLVMLLVTRWQLCGSIGVLKVFERYSNDLSLSLPLPLRLPLSISISLSISLCLSLSLSWINTIQLKI